MSTVAVEPSLLRWALDRSHLSEGDVQHKFPKIVRWLAGETRPTLRQLESLAKATSTPLGFFFLKEPPVDRLPLPYFRTAGDEAQSTPSPNLVATVHLMQRRQSWMREFLVEQGQERRQFVRSATLAEQPTSIARRLRIALALGNGWAAAQRTWEEALRVLRQTMEAAGILVFVNGVVANNTHRRLDPNEFRGFVMVDDYAPLVFVNGADGKAAQMFTLAHELAHVAFGSSAAFDLREMLPADDPTERACNRLAAEFLVPEDEMRQTWRYVRGDLDPFQSMARQFKVSRLVSARRALDLHLIDRDGFLDFYRRYQRDQRRTAPRGDGGDFYATQNLRVGRRFGRAVIRAAREGRLLYSEAYQLTGLYGKTLDAYASFLGIGGRA